MTFPPSSTQSRKKKHRYAAPPKPGRTPPFALFRELLSPEQASSSLKDTTQRRLLFLFPYGPEVGPNLLRLPGVRLAVFVRCGGCGSGSGSRLLLLQSRRLGSGS